MIWDNTYILLEESVEGEVPHVTTMSENIFLNDKPVLFANESSGMTNKAQRSRASGGQASTGAYCLDLFSLHPPFFNYLFYSSVCF